MMKLELNRQETPAEAGLREWAEAQASGPEFARIHGALHGVIATSTEEADFGRSALRLLRIDAPDKIHALAAQAARELQALQLDSDEEDEDELLTVPQLTEEAVFTEWMAGLGVVGVSDPKPFQALLSARAELAQEVKNQAQRRRHDAEDDGMLREATNTVISLMCLTPDEYLPTEFPPEARATFAKLRDDYLHGSEWEPVDRDMAALDALDAVSTAWNVHRMLSRMQVRSLLDGEEGWQEAEPVPPIRREGRKIRPNEPCPCGSGKKYKKCHGAPGAAPLL